MECKTHHKDEGELSRSQPAPSLPALDLFRPDLDGKLLLSREEAAEALGISDRMLSTLTKEHDLPCLRIGTRVLYSPLILLSWILVKSEPRISDIAGHRVAAEAEVYALHGGSNELSVVQPNDAEAEMEVA